jgi:hypothetical protein
MTWLRIVLVLYALMYLVAGGILVHNHIGGIVGGAYFLLNGIVITVAAIFERGRYRPHSRSNDDWELTNERFIDDVSGKKMLVRHNRQTGERDYVEEDQVRKEESNLYSS